LSECRIKKLIGDHRDGGFVLMRDLRKYPALFVTGTDTDVGKTVVTAALARWMAKDGREVCAIKPIATGCRQKGGGWVCEDAQLLADASSERGRGVMRECGLEPGQPLVAWKHALGPSCAARLEDRPMRLGALTNAVGMLRSACEREGVQLIVEGVGGPLVPLSGRFTVADWMARLEMPAVLVTRTELGTISHTLMAVECLTSRGVRLAGIIASRRRSGRLTLVERESLGEIARLLPRVRMVVLEQMKDVAGRPKFRESGW
jgi:dethiobiotin synthetase